MKSRKHYDWSLLPFIVGVVITVVFFLTVGKSADQKVASIVDDYRAGYDDGYEDGLDDGWDSAREYVGKAQASIHAALDIVNGPMGDDAIPVSEYYDTLADHLYDALAWLEMGDDKE